MGRTAAKPYGLVRALSRERVRTLTAYICVFHLRTDLSFHERVVPCEDVPSEELLDPAMLAEGWVFLRQIFVVRGVCFSGAERSASARDRHALALRHHYLWRTILITSHAHHACACAYVHVHVHVHVKPYLNAQREQTMQSGAEGCDGPASERAQLQDTMWDALLPASAGSSQARRCARCRWCSRAAAGSSYCLSVRAQASINLHAYLLH